MSAELNPEMATGWDFTAADADLAAVLRERVPERVFDAHMHLYAVEHIDPCPAFVRWGPERADLGAWRRYMGSQIGESRLSGALCTPFPSKGGSIEAVNEFVVEQAAGDENCRANIVISPESSRQSVEALLENPNVVGFKPYHIYSKREHTFDSEIDEYMPEWAWELANQRGLVILLHMVKPRALADPVNREQLIRFCAKYPAARLILAHAARGFHAPNTTAAISSLHGLNNVWFDTSAVCEPQAIEAILDAFGPRRVMWGSDFPVSQQRGRCVTLGNGFAWVTTDQVAWNDHAFFGAPVLVGLESLRALLRAADALGLNDGDLDDVFRGNALRLLGMQDEGGDVTQNLYRKAKTLIPGGVQLLSKRPEMAAPDQWPAYYREARGCEIVDLDGRHYVDCSLHGIGSTLLGFRDPDVTRAVVRRVRLGSWATLSPPDEVELAERLCAIHPWAEQARFARTGGEVMAMAVRIARAATDRSVVAVCGYHGWHDWYLAANLGSEDALRGHLLPGLDPLGVPRELRGTNFTFTYNNRTELDRIVEQHGPRLAAVVMEPCRYADPEPGFLEYVRDRAHGAGALLIFDEITIGWRLTYGGAHLKFGVSPDMATFGKTLSNGHLMAAVIGTRPAMEGAHGSFISSSYWTEGVGPAAALATLDKMARVNVPRHCRRIGLRIKDLWQRCAALHEIPVEIDNAYPAMAHFAFKHDRAQALKTLFVQSMLERGFLANTAIYVTLAHTDEIVDRYETAVGEAFADIGDAIRKGDIEQRLKGPVAHTGFRRLL
ncbi:aminotransferase class III-fold pyridoxal phosphate-dependent enzyme [Verrucomicrobiota bacterium]